MKKIIEKKSEKSSKKVLTRVKACDILHRLSVKDSVWTLKIKQRDKEKEPEIFLKVLKYFSTVKRITLDSY